MAENDTSQNRSADHKVSKPGKSLAEQIPLWIGIAGSLVTILLTVWNTHTKWQIDKREEDLKALEIKLKERVTGVEESKERVDRYKWVLSLFPVLNAKDEKERNFTISLIRLALTKDEAEQLFAGLQASPDTSLQSIGQNGISAIQNEPITLLVTQMPALQPSAKAQWRHWRATMNHHRRPLPRRCAHSVPTRSKTFHQVA